MKNSQSLQIAKKYLGKKVKVTIDRPLGLKHPKHGFVYANEADLFNVVVFGMTNKEWKRLNPTLKGNQRDNASALDNHERWSHLFEQLKAYL